MNEFDEKDGGFYIPLSFTGIVEKKGVFFNFVRKLGQSVIKVGAYVRSFGYSQKETVMLKYVYDNQTTE